MTLSKPLIFFALALAIASTISAQGNRRDSSEESGPRSNGRPHREEARNLTPVKDMDHEAFVDSLVQATQAMQAVRIPRIQAPNPEAALAS